MSVGGVQDGRKWRAQLALATMLAIGPAATSVSGSGRDGATVASGLESPDAELGPSGERWRRRDGIPDGFVYAVASSERGVVAVGSVGIWYSADGRAWERVLAGGEFPDPTSVQVGSVTDVTVGGPGFVAVGQALAATSAQVVAAVWTSRDGRVWTRVASPVFEEGTAPIPEGVSTSRSSIQAVTAGGPGLVAVGDVFTGTFRGGTLVGPCCTPVAWTSPDGATWTRRPVAGLTTAGSATLRDVTLAGQGLVAVGDQVGHPAAWTSPDGVSWRQLPPARGAGWFSAVAATGSRVVAVGGQPNGASRRAGRAAIWTLEEHARWKLRATAPPARVTEFSSIAVGDAGFAAVGWRGRFEVTVDALVWVSPNGGSWGAVNQAGDAFAKRTALHGVTTIDDSFLAFGQETTVGTGSQDDPFRPASVFWHSPSS